jgi:DNA-binding GntR family transcriptional regulator
VTFSVDRVNSDKADRFSGLGGSVESVVAAIRDHIRSMRLLPGEQVRQSDWAARVGVSRVPVREALNSLALAGVLTHDPNRGFFLTKYSQTELAQLHKVRGIIEVECVRTLDWPSAKEMKALKDLNADMRDAVMNGDSARWLQAHDELHLMVLSLSPLTVLAEEADRLYVRTESFRALRAHNTLQSSHADSMYQREVIEVLQEHDRDRLIDLYSQKMRVREDDLQQWTSLTVD